MRKQLTTRQQAFIFIGLIAFWVISIVLLLRFKHWIITSVLISLPFDIEYALRCYKAKKVLIPQFGEKQPKEEAKQPEANIITSISDLTVKQFIQCYAYGKYSVLGIGTDEQLKDGWGVLFSQYHEARKDDSLINYLKLIKQIKILELHRYLITTICAIMKQRYSQSAADVLRSKYPAYKFSKESFEKDLKMVEAAEISNKLKYENLLKQLKIREDANGGKELSPEEKEQDIIDSLIDIRKHENVNYDQNIMTVMEFARCQHRILKHIEQLKLEANKR